MRTTSRNPAATALHNAAMRGHATNLCRATLASLTVFGAACAAPNAARADWTLAAAASVEHDNNVGNAQADNDKVADFSAAARLTVLQLIPIGEDYSLAAGGDLAAQIYDHLSGLRNGSLDLVLSLKKKWGLGAFAPWARAGISLGRTDYQDGYRDATIYNASVDMGKRIDERWNLWGSYAFERRAAAPAGIKYPGISNDAFSQDGRTFTANVEYTVSERVFVSAGSLLRHGDVVSSTRAGGNLYASSKAIADDPTFGPYWYAYRLNGTTYGVRLGADFSLTVHSLIGCGFQRSETHAQGGNNYASSMPEITWNYRF
jgi:hypothetical protein